MRKKPEPAIIQEKWPRHYGIEAAKIYRTQGKQSAIDYISKECPKEWRRLAWDTVVHILRFN